MACDGDLEEDFYRFELERLVEDVTLLSDRPE